jgi:hypothetical protein
MICRDCVGSGEDDVYGGRCRVCGGTGQIRLTEPAVTPPAAKPQAPARKFLGVRRFWQHGHCLDIPYFEGDVVQEWAKDTPLLVPGTKEWAEAPYERMIISHGA